MSSLAFYVCVSHIFEKKVAHNAEALGLLFYTPNLIKHVVLRTGLSTDDI